jgi:hypothetical protein
MRPYLKNRLKTKELDVWLKWEQGPEFNPRYHQETKQKDWE